MNSKYLGSPGDRTYNTSGCVSGRHFMNEHGTMTIDNENDIRISKVWHDRAISERSFNLLRTELLTVLADVNEKAKLITAGDRMFTMGCAAVIKQRLTDLMDRQIIERMSDCSYNLCTGVFNDDKDATLPEISEEIADNPKV